MKTCTKCGETKELTEFSKRKDTKDGLAYTCKACFNAYNKAHYQANKEHILERHRVYHKANRESRKEYHRKWYRANKGRIAELQREYKKAHPLKRREFEGRRRAREHGVPIGHADYELVVATSNGLCGICGDPIFGKFDIDHIVPLTKGGAHSTDNLQVAHHHCNVSKGNKEAA